MFICPFFHAERKRYIPAICFNKDLSTAWEKLLNLDERGLVNMSKFIKIIFKQFTSVRYDSSNDDSDLSFILSTKETRCGRKIVQPARYSCFI